MVKRRLAAFNELIAEIGKTRESQGTFPALARVFKIIKAHLFLVSDAILFARSLDDTLPDVQLDDALTIREATMDDLVLFEPTSTPSEMMYIRTELAGEARCLIALKNGQLASYLWFTPQVVPSVHFLYLPLAPDEVYVYDGVTPPAFRRQGIQRRLHEWMFHLLRESGYRRALTLVGVGNYPSLQMDSTLYRVIGRIVGIKVFRLMYFRYYPKVSGRPRRVTRWLGI